MVFVHFYFLFLCVLFLLDNPALRLFYSFIYKLTFSLKSFRDGTDRFLFFVFVFHVKGEVAKGEHET